MIVDHRMDIDEKAAWLASYSDGMSTSKDRLGEPGKQYRGTFRKNFIDPSFTGMQISVVGCTDHEDVIAKLWNRVQEELRSLLWILCERIENERDER